MANLPKKSQRRWGASRVSERRLLSQNLGCVLPQVETDGNRVRHGATKEGSSGHRDQATHRLEAPAKRGLLHGVAAPFSSIRVDKSSMKATQSKG